MTIPAGKNAIFRLEMHSLGSVSQMAFMSVGEVALVTLARIRCRSLLADRAARMLPRLAALFYVWKPNSARTLVIRQRVLVRELNPKDERRHQPLRSPRAAGVRRLEHGHALGTVPGGRKPKPRGRLVSVRRSRQSPAESANREEESEAGLS